jgi:hypothetical protein
MPVDVDAAVARFYAVKETLSPIQAERAEFFRGQGVAYVWGLKDCCNDIDGLVGDAFSWAYGTVVALFEAGKITNHPSIQDSWQSFRRTGAIQDYHGRALDRITLTDS